MAGSLGTLTLDLIARIGGFTGPIDQAGRAAKKSSKEMVEAANQAKFAWSALGEVAAGVVAGLSVASIFGRFVSETRNAEREQAQLSAVLRSTGESAGFNRDQLNGMAAAMERATTFSGGDINQAQTTLLAFTGVIGNQFNRALQSAADMATRTGVTVKDAAETIGRALDVPSKGLTSLSKPGFRFTDEQKKMALAMESTGNVAGAQGIILDALEESYSGAAAAARNTFGRALDALQHTISGLLTGEGSLDAAKDAVNALNKVLGSPEAKAVVEATAKAAVVLAGVLSVRLAAAAATAAASFVRVQYDTARYQATLATMAGVSRTAAAGITAMSVTARAASASMALLGGPAGILIAVGTALTYFAMKTDDARQSLIDVSRPLDELSEKFRALGRDQKAAQLAEYTADFEQATKDQADAYSTLMKRVNRDLGSSLFPRIKKEFDEAYAAGQPLSLVIDDLSRRFRLKPEALQAWVAQSGAVADAGEKASYAATLVKRLTDEFNANSAAAATNAGTVPERSTVYTEMAKKIEEQILLAGKRTEADKLEARVKAGLVEGLKAGEGDLLVASQRRADAAIKAAAATKKAEEDAKSKSKAAADALKKRGIDAEEGYRRQIALIDETTGKQGKATEVAKLAFELETGKLKGVSAERKKVLQDLAAELDAKVKLQKQNQEDLKLATYAANLKDSNTIVRQGFELEIAGAGQGEKFRSRLRENLAIEQDFAKQRSELYKQFKEADLLGDPDAKARYDKETALLEEALTERLAIQQDYYSQLDAAESNWADGARAAWQDYSDNAKDMSSQMYSVTSNALGSLEDELVNFVKTGKFNFSAFAEGIANDLLHMLVKIGLQMAVNAAIGDTAAASSAAVAAVTGTSMAAAYAPAAAMASLASFGANAAPASAALTSTTALASSLSLVGMAHDGIDSVPREGTWLLQKGERVTTAGTSAKLDRTLSDIQANGGQGQWSTMPPIQQHISVQGSADEATLARIQEAAKQGAQAGYQMVLKDFRSNGPARQQLRKG
ncbi:phage tail tape measure protein [Pseudomonas sp. MF6396]|uniref:phage tail tape measure protein n=1 Tax=Pseudomonas sp. MF6396 TaxID=1960828 RepID=UPI00099801C6|nr:phage tail tape measure protein [Pseudomonas sp. MF6396]OOW04172.1 phage tail tape measure protein [Pseudomonas sp. MF6396]